MINKVVIIGCGNVGMSYAYALLNQRTYVNELILIDLDEERIKGEVMDLNHCLAFAPSKLNIKVGNYSDCKDASIVVIAAGANQNIGETRMDLINKNSTIFKNIVDNVMNSGFNARLRYLIGSKIGISPKNIHAYVIGEHGDSEFVPWSNANISLQNIKDYISADDMDNIYVDVRDAAYEIINRKGATYYGIGMCLVRITNAILGDENTVITVSNYDDKNDIYISTPCIINRNGIDKRIFINLNEEEENKLQNSIDTIKGAIDNLKL